MTGTLIIMLLLLGCLLSYMFAKRYGSFKLGDFICGMLLSIVLLLPILPILIGIAGIFPNTGEIVMTGYVADVAYKGIIWKTTEIQLYVDAQTSSEPVHFSSPNRSDFEKLNLLRGKKVEIYANTSGKLPIWQGSSKNLITKITKITKK